MRRVKFLESAGGYLATLEIEGSGGLGATQLLRDVLFELRVQVVRTEVVVEGRRRCERLTLVEFDGSAISARRRLELQVAVLAALSDEPLLRHHGRVVAAGPHGPQLAKGMVLGDPNDDLGLPAAERP